MCSRRLAAIATIAALRVLASRGEAHAGDPTLEWYTLETDHFVIHYYTPNEDLGRRVAVIAERAHDNLAPALGKVPDEKTQVILLDDTDGANGFASVLPRNRITLFATAAIGESALADHDDWLYGLFTHEYVHILHLDSIGGLPKVINKVLGKTWSPNQIQPRWVIEGLATYEESKRSSAGRIRSNSFDMFVRTAVLQHKQLGLDEITNGPDRFPRGNAAYLYGGKFLAYVFDRFGDDKARDMSWASGQFPIPYAVNRQIHAVIGKPFTELWADWKSWLRDKYTLQLEAVERAGVREGRRLTFDTASHQTPQYTADGKELVFLAQDSLSKNRLRAIPVGGNIGDARDVLELRGLGGWAMLSDGSVVYEQTWTHRIEYSFQDLFLWDRATGKTTRLTHGKRARDPSPSPDGKQVAFAINGGSHTTIAVMPLLAGAESKVVWDGERFDQAFQPGWSPDGGRLAFTAWRQGGFRDIVVLDLATGDATELSHDRAIEGDPTWSPDGAYLFFSSDRTGIYNIYAHELATGALWQVTNVIGGAFDPSVSPDGARLAYYGFDIEGYDIFEIALDKAAWTAARPYVDDRPEPSDVRDDGGVAILGPRTYRPLETVGPQAWRAEYRADTAIGQAVTLRTGGNDAAGLHNWTLGATVSLEDGRVNLGLNYGYGGLRMPVRLTGGRNIATRNGYRIDGLSREYTEETFSSTLSFSVPTRRSPGASVTLSGDLDFDYFHLVDIPDDPLDPSQVTPRPPLSNYLQTGIALRGAWNNSQGYAETLGPIEGTELSGSIRYDDPVFGATYRNLTLSWTFRTYAKLPWGVTPALSFRYAGGVRVGDVDRGASFSLGSTPDQDVASALIGTARVSTTGYLRGYERRVVQGDTFHLANLEYRQGLFSIEHGLATLPIYLRKVHVAGLFDAGTAYDDTIAAEDVKVSVGGALRLDLLLGWFAPGTFEVGYARGLSTEGISETWLLLTTTI